MKTKNIFLMITLSAMLAACGSSSSQGIVAPTSGNNQSDVGLILKLKNTNGAVLPSTETFYTGDGDINTITVNGNQITLIPTGVSSGGGFYDENQPGTRKIVSGTNYQHSRFGALDITANGADVYAFFSQGKPTAISEIPTTGTATYSGHAVGVVEGASGTTVDFTTGNSTINVDFAAKTVSGTLNGWVDNNMPTVTFTNATISGNSFIGAKASGKFYGPNAAEVSGVVQKTAGNGDVIAASFGAKKQ